MPRRPRQFIPGVPLHIIQRGNNRQACFITERDYVVYLGKLDEYRLAYGVAVHSYILMTNHVHLLVTPETAHGASDMLQALGRYYVRYINATYRRTGTLWEGRFRASLVNSSEYLLTLSRYIELNPVRANMVAHPAEYPWSSYRLNGLGKPIRLLTPHRAYQALGNNHQARQAAYRALFRGRLGERALEQIRTATNKGWVLGDQEFKQKIERQLGYRIPPFERGGDRKSAEFKNQRGQSNLKIKLL